jgi:hypothetical protein
MFVCVDEGQRDQLFPRGGVDRRTHKTHKTHTHTGCAECSGVGSFRHERTAGGNLGGPVKSLPRGLSCSLLPPLPPELASCPVTARKAEGVEGFANP